MSLEQQRQEAYFEEKETKRSLEKRDQFLLEKKIMRESSDLLKKLAIQISKEFGINISEASILIESGTSQSLENLKLQISNNPEINLRKLQEAISKAQNSIEDLSKKHRESLKNLLEKEILSPETHIYYTSKKMFSDQAFSRAKYPKNIGDQLIGLSIGLIESSEAIVILSYELGKGILLTPYHLYLLLTGKGEYEMNL